MKNSEYFKVMALESSPADRRSHIFLSGEVPTELGSIESIPSIERSRGRIELAARQMYRGAEFSFFASRGAFNVSELIFYAFSNLSPHS